ncbi:MAG: NTP transferase domain-containing protein [Candidatus Omnitrophica bacterium]|nr:NTP transferase domain-containing protein [Candidatus Omnitrophota bacterium]
MKNLKDLTAVILCGGKGLRIGELTAKVPKPLIEIGSKPILWHVMKIFACQGVKRFILCLGYRGKHIRDYFRKENKEGWDIRCINTGVDSLKSRRILQVEHLIKTDNFFLAYGDDVADININKLLSFHLQLKPYVTITTVRMSSDFGIVKTDNKHFVTEFSEKPVLNEWINGGFMVMNKKVFDYLDEGELEKDIFNKFAKLEKICAYKHNGSWKAMNTLKDYMELNRMWKQKQAFWNLWERKK